MPDNYNTRAEREFGVISGDELTADAVSDILAGRTVGQVREANGYSAQEYVAGLSGRSSTGAARRVEDARENVLDAALNVADAVTTGTDVQQAVAELVTDVQIYRTALENH